VVDGYVHLGAGQGRGELEQLVIMSLREAKVAPELIIIIIIRESKYLDRLGYQLPEAILDVTLQEDKSFRYVQDINLMLKYYKNLMSRMSAVELQMLKEQIAGLQKVIKAGFTPLDWSSQRIPRLVFCPGAIDAGERD
jgi:hypothetical protein